MCTIAALISSAAIVHASELSPHIKATADLFLSLDKIPAEDRIAAVTSAGYTQQQAPFATMREWYEAPLSPGEMSPDEMGRRWKRLDDEFSLTDEYDSWVLFAAPTGDTMLSFPHPQFRPAKNDGTQFHCAFRGYGWAGPPEMEAALAAAGFTQPHEEHWPVIEPNVTLLTRSLPGGDDRDVIIVASFRSAIAQYDTSSPIFAITVVLHHLVLTS